MQFPIQGSFSSKRGIHWNFRIYSDLSVEQYHSSIIRSNNGGWKRGKDIYAKTVTKECKEYIESTYGIKVK